MEQWDIMCCKCGKFILTEQQEKTGNIKCVKGSYDDGFYDGSEDQFYCKGCAEKYNKNWRFHKVNKIKQNWHLCQLL